MSSDFLQCHIPKAEQYGEHFYLSNWVSTTKRHKDIKNKV